ncbi:MAG TPA: cation transporting ATPase C-terminal domain-containing protein, partial [Anaerolineales bacterium]|nr:cation transporting ATPase C-terminal domain-containing protein [Anaerolineales bacterium]
TLAIEQRYAPVSPALAATMGFVVFSLFNIVVGVASRSISGTAFVRDSISDRRQLGLFGLSFLLIFLPTELAFLSKRLGLTPLSGEEWRLAIGLSFVLLLVTEVIKFLLRRTGSRQTA